MSRAASSSAALPIARASNSQIASSVEKRIARAPGDILRFEPARRERERPAGSRRAASR